MIRYSVFLLLQLSLSYTGIAQVRTPVKDISQRMEREYLSLKKTFGEGKTIPAEFEKEILMALSYFPELQHTRISFRLRKGNSGILSTRPTWLGLFRNGKRRSYVVFIGDSSANNIPTFSFRNCPVNGRVGIIGHELTHIYNFSRKNSLGLLSLGIRHLSTEFIDNFENKTDSVCIERGLGYQLMEWNIYLRKSFGMADPYSGPDPFFTNTKKERYMSPARIREVMSKSKAYKQVI